MNFLLECVQSNLGVRKSRKWNHGFGKKEKAEIVKCRK